MNKWHPGRFGKHGMRVFHLRQSRYFNPTVSKQTTIQLFNARKLAVQSNFFAIIKKFQSKKISKTIYLLIFNRLTSTRSGLQLLNKPDRFTPPLRIRSQLSTLLKPVTSRFQVRVDSQHNQQLSKLKSSPKLLKEESEPSVELASSSLDWPYKSFICIIK